MPGANDATTQTNDTYADMASVFDSLITKEGTEENAENLETDQDAGAADTSGNAEQQTDQAAGAGDSTQHQEPGADQSGANGDTAQTDAGNDAAGGDQGNQGVDHAARIAELEAQLAAATKAPPQAAPAPEQQAQTPAEPEVFTAEEAAELDTLSKEWPDLHRLFTLMGRQLQVDTLKYAFSEVGKVIAPLQETVNTYTTSDHKAAIYDAHEDYDEVYQPTMDWIEKQPAFLKAAYQNVAKQGTAEEVATMIQKFKDETGWKAPAAQGTGKQTQTPAAQASAPAQQQAGLSEAAKKAARAMGAVGGKRSAATNAQDPNDFDSAWDEAINTPTS